MAQFVKLNPDALKELRLSSPGLMEELAEKYKLIDDGLYPSLTLDELLYDGHSLHTSMTLSNPTGETLLYTVDGLSLGGQPLDRTGGNLLIEKSKVRMITEDIAAMAEIIRK